MTPRCSILPLGKAFSSVRGLVVTVLSALLLVAGCGGDDGPTLAESNSASVTTTTPGPSPFISLVTLNVTTTDQIRDVWFTIAPRPGSSSKPVHVKQTASYLARMGHLQAGAQSMTLPVFGLYAGYANDVWVVVTYSDGSTDTLRHSITTGPYLNSFNTYDQVNIIKARQPGAALGFDFMVLRSNVAGQVVLDTDGQVRWAAGALPPSLSVFFTGESFLIGSQDSLEMRTVNLDGSVALGAVQSAQYTQFHHNIDAGKVGYLTEFDAVIDGQPHFESILAEIDAAGTVLREWDFAKIVSEHMTEGGDDATAFVRPGIDWFHMNAAAYDPTDDTIIASSRENFLIKVGYSDRKIVWIFGDPTKYWHTFPSLRAKAISLPPAGLYPIGQHSVSVLRSGEVMIFNNGQASLRQPTGSPVGESRAYSLVNAYRIDPIARAATETWTFDQDQSVSSLFCSSAYLSPDGSALINYSRASQGTKARFVGLDATKNIVFDFELPTAPSCQTSFNATTVPFDQLVLD